MDVYDVIFEIRQTLAMKCNAELKVAIIDEIMDEYIFELMEFEEPTEEDEDERD